MSSNDFYQPEKDPKNKATIKALVEMSESLKYDKPPKDWEKQMVWAYGEWMTMAEFIEKTDPLSRKDQGGAR